MRNNNESGSKSCIFYWVHAIICIALILGFGYLRPFGSLSQLGMQVLGIFIGLLYGWTFIGFIWPSLLGLIALGFTEYGTVAKVFAAGFGDVSVVVFLIFVFIFSAYMDKIGLNTAIANWFISRKFTVGRPWLFSLMILLATYVLGATVSMFASILLVWNIFYSVCDVVGYKKGDKYPAIMLVGIVYSAMLGISIFPFKAFQVMILGSLQKVSGLTVNFLDFTLLTFVVSILSLIFFVLVIRVVLRPDVAPLTKDIDHFAHLRGQKLNQDQKVGAFFLTFFMIVMFAPSILPKGSAAELAMTRLGLTGSLAMIVMILALVKINGKEIFSFSEAAKGINWDIVIMMVATMPISQAMSSPEVGVMPFFVQTLSPIFQGMNPVVFTVAFVVIAGVITQVAHNFVLGALLTPIAYSFSVSLGANPLLVVTLLSFALTIAMATPGGSAPGALVYCNREWINVKSAYQYAITAVLVELVIVAVIGVPLGMIIF